MTRRGRYVIMPMSRPVAQHLDYLRLRGLRPNTLRSRRYALDRLARHVNKDLLDVSRGDLEDWHRSLLRLTPLGRAHELSHVASFYRWACANSLIAENPAADLPRPRIPRRVPRPMPERDVRTAIVNAPRRIRPWLILAGWCGLRACEIAYLQRSEILDTADPPVIVITDGKGGEQRVVPLPAFVIAELHAYGMPSRGFVFRRGDGEPGPNTPGRISYLANEYLHEVGVTATLHQLRHRYGSEMYRLSGDLRLVQEVLGHHDPATTAGYVAYSRERARDAAAQLGGTLERA